MRFALVFVAVLVVIVRAEKCEFDEETYSVIRKGSRSEAVDDAEAQATCQKGETLAACRCETFDTDPEPCDGSSIKETADGFLCIAKNCVNGKGVVAVAHCQKTVITCTTKYGDMPSISCPEFYKPLSCTMHRNFILDLNKGKKRKPQSKRSGNKCYTTKGCTNCQVQARCIRWTNFKIQKSALPPLVQ